MEVIFRGTNDEKLILKQLRDKYSIWFKLMKTEILGQIRYRNLQSEIDNIVCLMSSKWKKNFEIDNIKEILIRQDNICGYLDALYMLRDKIIVMMATKDTSGKPEDVIVLRKIKRLGFRKFPAKLWWMYAGIIFKGTVLVDYSPDAAENPVEVEQMIGQMRVRLKAESFRKGNRAVITIDENEYAHNLRGINIVVCDASNGKVIDSVSYDTFAMDYFRRKN